MRKVAFLLTALSIFTSCHKERISYDRNEIEESLYQLQEARNELRKFVSDLEYSDFIDYDCAYESDYRSKLENVDRHLEDVVSILDK